MGHLFTVKLERNTQKSLSGDTSTMVSVSQEKELPEMYHAGTTSSVKEHVT